MKFLNLLAWIRNQVSIRSSIIGEDIRSQLLGNDGRLARQGDVSQEDMKNFYAVGIEEVVLASDRIRIDEIILWLNLEVDLGKTFTELENIIGVRFAFEKARIIRSSQLASVRLKFRP